MNDLDNVGELLRAGKYADVLQLLLATFPNGLPNSELAKIASFCEVKLGQPKNAINRLLAVIQKNESTSSLLISLCFAYASNKESEKVESLLLEDIDFSHLTLQEINEIKFLINEFSFTHYFISQVLNRLADLTKNEATLGQLLNIANQKQVPASAYVIADRLYRNFPKNNYLVEKAIALRFLNRPEEGARIIEGLLLKVNHFAIHHNLGNMYSDLGRLQDALLQYQKAIALNPTYVDSLVNYARVAFELGRERDWLEPLEKQLKLQPQNKALHLAYMNLLFDAKCYKQALEHLEKTGISSSDPIYVLLKAKGKRLLQQPQEAVKLLLPFKIHGIKELNLELLEAALDSRDITLASEMIVAIQKTPDIDFRTRQIAKANDYIVRSLTRQPLGFTLSSATEEIVGLPPEVSLSTVKSTLLKLHENLFTPVNQSVQKGTQTRGNLFPSHDLHLQKVEHFIKQRIAEYVKKHHTILDVPTESNPSTHNIIFTGSWSVLNKSDGYHVPHYHSKGLVSGVFYVDVPDALTMDDKAGHLHLGMVDRQPFYKIEPALTVKPESGKIVLFPSHVWHGTFPTALPEARLTIAFDAVVG